MLRRVAFVVLTATAAIAQTAGPAKWQNDLAPIGPTDWNYDFAAHLLERAGFGGTPDEIQALAKMTPAQAIARLVRFEGTDVEPFAALRSFRHPRSRTRTVSAQPPRRHRPGQGERRSARHQSETRGQPPPPAHRR